jgi:hypothetical protein
MLLLQPVNWDLVVSTLAKALAAVPVAELDISPRMRLLNFGPGTGLMRSTGKAFKNGHGVSVDLTLDGGYCGERKPKQGPIAIVGMAVNIPGAPNTAKLWEVLEHGINTCSEVIHFSSSH